MQHICLKTAPIPFRQFVSYVDSTAIAISQNHLKKYTTVHLVNTEIVNKKAYAERLKSALIFFLQYHI